MTSFKPRVVETLIGRTAIADIRGHHGKVGVSKEVADGFGTTEGKDGVAFGLVDRDVASHICEQGAGNAVLAIEKTYLQYLAHTSRIRRLW